MNRSCAWSVVIVALVPVFSARADFDPQTLFTRAAASYDAGQFGLAASQYDSLITTGQETPEVYFNLGNAYFRAGSLGQAIWAYRSAEELAPRDADIDANLTVARLACRDRIETAPASLLQQLWRTVSKLLSLTEGARLVTLLWLALWLVIAAALFLRRARRWVMPFVRVLALAWALSAITFTVRYVAARNTKAGVVVASETQARSAPGAEEDVVFSGHAGLECIVRGQKAGFLLIELANGRVGWVAAADLKLVES
jgi:hypothetical protein